MSYDFEGEHFYSDDPIIDKVQKKRWKNTSKLAAIALTLTAIFAVNGTFAANISLGAGVLEFGQGVLGLKTCANDANISIKQKTQYSGSAFFLKSMTISSIPASCSGYDLILSALAPGAAGSSILSPFFGSVTRLIIYDKAGTFYTSTADAAFLSLSSTTDGVLSELTITFNSLVLNADAIGSIGLESSENTLTGLPCGSGGDCALGAIGPNGGVVVVSSTQGFSSPSSPCDLNCHFIEIETGTLVSEVWSKTSAGTATNGAVGATYHGLGGGYMNTKLAQLSSNGANNNASRNGAISYCWNNTKGGAGTGANRWYLPTVMEYAYFFDAVKSNAAVRSRASSWPAVTAYYTSEESSSTGTFPSLWSSNWTSDGPPAGIAFQSNPGDSTGTTGAISVEPKTNVGGGITSTFSNFAQLLVFPHNKVQGYGILCAHSFN